MPEFSRSASPVLFKNAVEVGDVVKSALEANLSDAPVSFDQLSRGRSQPDFNEEFNKRFARTLPDQPAK